MFKKVFSLAILLLAPALHAQPLHQIVGGCGGVPPERTIEADPTNYVELIRTLQPGDRLLLAPGVYDRQVPIRNLNGQPDRCIVIEGPAEGAPAVLHNSDVRNTISLRSSSYLVIRNLQLNGQGRAGDGVKVEADSAFAHHITLENLKLVGYHGGELNRVGISTKAPAWNFVIRHVRISGAGVGMYLGRANGTGEFVNSLIEHNVVANSQLYDVQIKHQVGRNVAIGMPASGTTVIRHNVFTKEEYEDEGESGFPNLLVGHWPRTGPGSDDLYQIYGNVFFLNPKESLFQGEGNIALHDNLFVQRDFPRAIRIQRHNHVPKRIEVFHNTVVSPGEGIVISGADPAYAQRVRGNAVFAPRPLLGGEQTDNLTADFLAADQYLNNPWGGLLLETLDLYPKPGTLRGTPVDTSDLAGLLDWDRDFNGLPRDPEFRGAYSGEGVNPGWQPAASIKP